MFFAIDTTTHGIRVVGDEAPVDFFTNKNKDLPDEVKKTLISVQSQQVEGLQGEGKLYSNTRLHLFAKPGSKDWGGVEKIRAQLNQLLSLGGYCHKEKTTYGCTYGCGDPPTGWPYHYIWANFTGPSRVSHS